MLDRNLFVNILINCFFSFQTQQQQQQCRSVGPQHTAVQQSEFTSKLVDRCFGRHLQQLQLHTQQFQEVSIVVAKHTQRMSIIN